MVERPSIFFALKKIKNQIMIDLGRYIGGVVWVGGKVGCSFFLWTLGLAFGGFTLCLPEDFNSYFFIGYVQLVSFNKVQPFDPMASRLGWP